MTSSYGEPQVSARNQQNHRRISTDSTAYLLSSASPSPSSTSTYSGRTSYAPSISSVLSDATTIEAPTHAQRGFKSRESYLAALQEFAESKSYMESNEHTLHGWYGTKTMDEINLEKKSLREERKQRKEAERRARDRERRRTVAAGMGSVAEEDGGADGIASDEVGVANGPGNLSKVESGLEGKEKQGRFRRLSRVFSGGRRATTA